MESYIGLTLKTFLILSVIVMLGFPFKRWVERQDGIKRKIFNPILMVVIGVGFVVDVVLNYLITPFFFEAPQRWLETVTMRMQRYKREGSGYKKSFATRLCRAVNVADPGHC